MEKNYVPKQEEISLVELIVIIFKYWKTGLVIFLIFYVLGVSVFIYKKKEMIFPKPGKLETLISNDIAFPYTWANNAVRYDDILTQDIISTLFKKGDIQSKLKIWPELKCSEAPSGVQISRGQNILFTINIESDNNAKVIKFSTILPLEEIRKSQRFPSDQDISRIHDMIIESFINNVENENQITYNIIRNEIISGLAALDKKKYKTRDEMEYFNILSRLFLEYRTPAKGFVRTRINVFADATTLPETTGMPLNKFMLFFFFMDFFVCLILIFAFEFFKKTNILDEISKSLKNT